MKSYFLFILRTVTIFAVLFLGFLFTNVSHAEASEKHWYNPGGDSSWLASGNWWTDATHTTPTTPPLPGGGDTIITDGTTTPIVDLSAWELSEASPASIDASSTGIIFTGNYSQFWGTLTGSSTLNDGMNFGTVTGNVTFNNSFSGNAGTIVGDVNFNGSSFGNFSAFGPATITGTVVFNGDGAYGNANGPGSTINGITTFNGSNGNSGIVNGDTTFNGSGNNNGTITGPTLFNDSSYNQGNIIGTTTFNDPTNFNGSNSSDGVITGTAIYTYAHDGTIYIPDGGAWGSGTASSNVGVEGVTPITSWVFNGASANYGTTTEAVFNDSSYNSGIVIGTSTYTYAHDGTIYIPDGGSWGSGTSGSNVGVDGITPITSWEFNGESYNNGTINGDATFNGSSVNSYGGNITGTAKYTYAHNGVITIPDGGQWGSGTAGSNVDASNAPITSWIFNGESYTFTTIVGTTTFNGTSGNAGTTIGNAIFNDSSSNNAWGSYHGIVTGDATFRGNLSENGSGDTVSGTKTRYYTTAIAPNRNFVSDGPWTVIADGAVVDLTGATFNGNTTFKVKNGGSFIPASPNDISPEVLPSDPVTLYFNAAVDNDWNTLGNWWTNEDFALGHEAAGLPTANDNVIISAEITSGGPVSVNTLTATSSAKIRIPVTVANGAFFFNTSTNWSDITGDATFNDSSYGVDFTTVSGIAKYVYATGGVITVPDGAQWSGTAGSNVGVDDAVINTWIFNGSSAATTDIVGTTTFNNSSDHWDGTITGNVTFNHSSLNEAAITGDAVFNGDTSENSYTTGGTVSGIKTRYYSTTITPTRNFIADGAWTVVADGAGVVVNLTGSTYDLTTTFKVKNGGSFIPASPNDISPEVIPSSTSSDSSLSALSVSEGTLTPVFGIGTLSYTASVANSITSLDITATKTDAAATMTIGGTSATNGVPVSKSLSVGDNTINVIVTAEDASISTYAIVVTRAAATRGSSGGSIRTTLPPLPSPPPACQPGDKFSTTTGLPCPLPTVCPVGHLFSVTTGLPCTSYLTIPIPPLTCSITHTLRLNSRGDEVKCLQTGLSISSDGIFGPITKAAVIVFQKSKSLVPDGVFGPRSRAVWKQN